MKENKSFYVIYHLLLRYYWTFGDEEAFGALDIIRSDALNLAIYEMVTAGGNHPDCPIDFGEFVELHNRSSIGNPSIIKKMVDFYTREPMSRPALQKMMLAQLCLSYAIHNACRMGRPDIKRLRNTLDDEEAPWAKKFRNKHINQAKKYVYERLDENDFKKYLGIT